MEVIHEAGGGSAGGSAGGSGGDEGGNQNHQEKRRRIYCRHTPNQTSRLEQLFNITPHPDETQRQEIAEELGMSANQVKFWFQNRRTQQKTRLEREDNSALHAENIRMKNEMASLMEAASTLLCQTCGVPKIVDVERSRSLLQLHLENKRLKNEIDKVNELLSWCKDTNPVSSGPQLQLGPPSLATSYDTANHPPNTALGITDASAENQGLTNLGGNEPKSAKERRAEIHRLLMYEAVKGAKEELFKLLFSEEDLWVHSPHSPANSQRQVLNPLNYDKMFPEAKHFNTPTARVESSKDSIVVKIRASQLVNMLMDQEKWANIFSTIVSRTLTLEVLDKGLQDNRDGALQLMFEEMHILSPLVPPREFLILRYCQKVEENGWVIGNVSFDNKKKGNNTYTTLDDALRAWKRPSGCFIQPLSEESSQVTWIEHVEVDDELRMPRLYRNIITSGAGYGAERWLMELQRMVDKFVTISTPLQSIYNVRGVTTMSPEGRTNLMKISDRMVSSFCEILNTSSRMHCPRKLPDQERSDHNYNNISGIRISVRQTTEGSHGTPIGTIAVAAISFWLPLPANQLFDFFRDPNYRVHWDALCAGQPMQEIAHFSTGSQPSNYGNYASVMRVRTPGGLKEGVLVMQENFTNRCQSYIVFTPINVPDFIAGVDGEEARKVAILPSGITICEDGQEHYSANASGASSSSSGASTVRGSILTLCHQLMVDSSVKDYGGVRIESVNSASSFITTIVHNIKTVLNCPRVEFD